MSVKIWFISLVDYVKLFRQQLMKFMDVVGIVASFAGFLVFLYHIGFVHQAEELLVIQHVYNVIIWVIIISTFADLALKRWRLKKLKQRIAEMVIIFLLLLILDARMGLIGVECSQSWLNGILNRNLTVYAVFIIALIIQVSNSSIKLSHQNTNPGLLFISSFLLLIVFGTGLLLLPNATYSGIGLTDAFFTSTSAVCVTGLIVVDTSAHFTPLGQVFILILIQIGGLGVMTFTSFFGYFFKGGASFGNEFLLKELINEEKLGEIFRTLMKIMIITFSIEAIGALLIFYTIEPSLFTDEISMVGFSVFHSVSAFCNAGFSTLSDGLYQQGFRSNYGLHYIIGILIILGGLGFPVVFNYIRRFRQMLRNSYWRLSGNDRHTPIPRVINLNTRIAVISTFILLVTGFIFFFLSEYHHSLEGLSLRGKIAGAFFGSVTPRTAGFNTIDMSLLAAPTLFLYLLLMWIGASPGSTGGGVKTTTFTVALLNAVSLAKGKDRLEVFHREIARDSIRRAFSAIFLSLLVIGLAALILTITDSNLDLTKVIFETVSAFGTVGLSLGITAQLSAAGKWVLIVTMFIGRIGTLTVLIGIFRKMSSFNYQYPSERIMIN